MDSDLANFADKYRTRHAPEYDIDPEDRAWHTEIPCAKSGGGGHIYTHGPGRLGYMGSQHCRKRQILKIPGVEIGQEGDQEFTALFPIELLDRVAKVVGAIKRKHLTAAHRAKLAATQFVAQAAAPAKEKRPIKARTEVMSHRGMSVADKPLEP